MQNTLFQIDLPLQKPLRGPSDDLSGPCLSSLTEWHCLEDHLICQAAPQAFCSFLVLQPAHAHGDLKPKAGLWRSKHLCCILYSTSELLLQSGPVSLTRVVSVSRSASSAVLPSLAALPADGLPTTLFLLPGDKCRVETGTFTAAVLRHIQTAAGCSRQSYGRLLNHSFQASPPAQGLSLASRTCPLSRLWQGLLYLAEGFDEASFGNITPLPCCFLPPSDTRVLLQVRQLCSSAVSLRSPSSSINLQSSCRSAREELDRPLARMIEIGSTTKLSSVDSPPWRPSSSSPGCAYNIDHPPAAL